MMIVVQENNMEINYSDCKINTLVIENRQLYRRIVYSFEDDYPEETMIFSSDYKPFNFDKKGLYVSSPLKLDFSEKKLMNKVNAYLEQVVNDEMYNDLTDLKVALFEFANKLTYKSDFNIETQSDIDLKAILKLFDFKLSQEQGQFAENFVNYIELISQYLGVSLFVVLNLHMFFEAKELDLIFETLTMNGNNLLCLEGNYPSHIPKCEKLHIIDSDLCTIE